MKAFKNGTLLLKYLLLAGSFLVGFACEEQPPPSLTSTQREMIDTLYLQKIEGIRTRLDSICDADFAVNVQKAVDSLLLVRKEEEARLRQRLFQPQ